MSRRSSLRWVILGLTWLTAFSSRTTIITVGPILPLIIKDLGLSYAQAGVLFSLPVAMMGLFSIPGGIIIARLGAKRSLIICLVLMGLGSGLRALAPNGGLLLWFTGVMGVGIGLVQPVLPSMVKQWFPEQPGTATGIYSTGFALGGVGGAWLAVPVLLPLSGRLSWRGPFFVWAVLVLLTAVGWAALRGSKATSSASLMPFAHVFRSRLAWIATGIFLTQSLVYYTLNSWLAGYELTLGHSLGEASTALGVFNLTGALGAFGGPYLADRIGRRRSLLISAAAAATVCIAALLLLPGAPIWLWPGILGVCGAILFTVCLVIPIDAAHGQDVGALSGMMFALGYGGVTIGPSAVGYLRDVSGSYTPGFLALIGVGVVMLCLSILLPETGPGARRPARAAASTTFGASPRG